MPYCSTKIIVAHAVVLDASDIRCLKPMAESKKAIDVDSFQVVADAGYSDGEQEPPIVKQQA